MKDKRPSIKDMDRDGDGITGHEEGIAQQGPSWVSENAGKLVIGGLILVVVIFVLAAIQDANAAKEVVT